MGAYNVQYEGYYKNLGRKIKNKFKQKKNHNNNFQNETGYKSLIDKNRNKYRGKRNSISILPNFGISNPVKTIIIQLSGTLVLFVLVLICKTVKLPQMTYAYEYGKKIVNENYDYEKTLSYLKNYDYGKALKNFDISKINLSLGTYLDKIKIKLEELTSAKEVLEKNFMVPCSGEILKEFNKEEDLCLKKEFHKGIDIACKENEITATNNGKIKEIGYCDEGGQYLIIDHGNGIESKYYFLKELNVDINQEVSKGDIIAKGSKTKDEKNEFIHFEITYMGEEKNPLEFIKN